MNRTSLARWARCTALTLLLALVTAGRGAPRAEAAAPPTNGAALLRVLPSSSLSAVTTTLQKLGLRVRWTDPAARLLVVDAPGSAASSVVSLVKSVSLLLGIEAVEQNLPLVLGSEYGGKQSQAAVCSDDLVAASMRWQGPMNLIGANPPPTAPGHAPVVAVVDGGFALDHEALPAEAVLSTFDAIDGDADVAEDGDGVDNDGNGSVDAGVGHGTAVAALALTAAPASRLVLIRALDDEGVGSFATFASGLDAALRRGAQVINLSAGSSQTSTIIEKILKDASAKGVVVACAAGNEAAGVLYPARSPYAFAVAGCRLDRTRDPVTNAGSSVDVGAPSVQVVGPAPHSTDGYAYWNGTSFATPLFSGAVALVLSVEGGTARNVAQRLLAATQPWADGSQDLGRGVLDLRPLRTW